MSRSDLGKIFQPRSVAVVGVSSGGLKHQFGGANFVHALLQCGFRGNIYPVNPKDGEVLGLKVYPSLSAIPEPVDYVICCIPAAQVPHLVEECAAKGVKAIQIYTGGFSESGSEQGRQWEQRIVSLARQNNIRIIGPNCVGLYSPGEGIAFLPDCPRELGHVGIISQSGGNSFYLVREGAKRGIRFSKVVSYGNASDVDESELLQFLAQDKDTEVIGVYIEGVKDGGKFVRALREASQVKPVVLLKGGVGEAGARAVASHTGTLVGSEQVWDALLRQFGVVRVFTLEELIDSLVAFCFLPVGVGRRVAIVGGGGGSCVLSTDACTSAGLIVPRFPEDIQDKLRSYMKKGNVGVILSNPVDLSDQGWGVFDSCFQTVLGYDGIDLVILQVAAGAIPASDALRVMGALFMEEIAKIRQRATKPVAVVVHSLISDDCWWVASEVQHRCARIGVPFYHSLGSAAKAIARLVDYYQKRRVTVEQGCYLNPS
jgi:acyl-CoA synthetase (NDP forming)